MAVLVLGSCGELDITDTPEAIVLSSDFYNFVAETLADATHTVDSVKNSTGQVIFNYSITEFTLGTGSAAFPVGYNHSITAKGIVEFGKEAVCVYTRPDGTKSPSLEGKAEITISGRVTLSGGMVIDANAYFGVSTATHEVVGENVETTIDPLYYGGKVFYLDSPAIGDGGFWSFGDNISLEFYESDAPFTMDPEDVSNGYKAAKAKDEDLEYSEYLGMVAYELYQKIK